jgi:nitrate reductase gamma subunit
VNTQVLGIGEKPQIIIGSSLNSKKKFFIWTNERLLSLSPPNCTVRMLLGLMFVTYVEVKVMEMLQVFLWIVYPYTVAAIVSMGLVWQYDSSREEDAATAGGQILVYLVRTFMIISSATGIAIVLSSSKSYELIQLLRWLVSLAQLQPDMNLIHGISILSKVHFIVVFLFLLSLAFTKEIYYLFKPHLYFKKIFLKLHLEKRG